MLNFRQKSIKSLEKVNAILSLQNYSNLIANLDIPLSIHPTNKLPHISSTPNDVPVKIDIYSLGRNYQLGKCEIKRRSRSRKLLTKICEYSLNGINVLQKSWAEAMKCQYLRVLIYKRLTDDDDDTVKLHDKSYFHTWRAVLSVLVCFILT